MRRFLRGGFAVLGVFVLFASTAACPAGDPVVPVGGKTQAWQPGLTTLLGDLTVKLSQPVLVARRKGFLWFPTIVRLSEGKLLVAMSSYADIHNDNSTAYYSWSSDGGLSWTDPVLNLYCEAPLTLANGDVLLLPYYMKSRGPLVMGAKCLVSPKGKQELIVQKREISVSGWSRPDHSFDEKLKLSGFVFNGQSATGRDGTYLATLYGTYQGGKKYELVLAESHDGFDWKLRSTIAGENAPVPGDEGPCESALCRLQDGRLMSVFRTAGNRNFGQTYSADDGLHWDTPRQMNHEFSVQPSLQTLPNGTVFLSGGRPGLYLWYNADKQGKQWDAIDLRANHNAFQPREPIANPRANSSNYTEIVVVDETHLLYVYDRIPHAWHAIPEKSTETNSVWVVQVTLHKK